MATTLDDVKVLLDTLVADVQRAIQDINDLASQLAAASQDPEKIQALADEISSATSALEAALPAETPPA